MKDKSSFEYSERQINKRIKKIQIALILPVIGLILFLTPFVDNFIDSDGSNQVGQLAVYIFGLWALMILLAAWLAHSLKEELSDD